MCMLFGPTLTIQVWHGRATVYDPTQLSVDAPGWLHHVSPSNVHYKSNPRFYLKSSTLAFSDDDTHQEYDLKIQQAYLSNSLPHEDSGHPWLLHLVMDHPPNPIEFYFCINDWEYTAYFAEPLMGLPEYIEPGTVCMGCCTRSTITLDNLCLTTQQAPLSFYTILTPLFVLDPSIAMAQIAQYAQHNAQLGFNATIMYERGPYLNHIQGDASLRKLLHSGNLQVCFVESKFSNARNTYTLLSIRLCCGIMVLARLCCLARRPCLMSLYMFDLIRSKSMIMH